MDHTTTASVLLVQSNEKWIFVPAASDQWVGDVFSDERPCLGGVKMRFVCGLEVKDITDIIHHGVEATGALIPLDQDALFNLVNDYADYLIDTYKDEVHQGRIEILPLSRQDLLMKRREQVAPPARQARFY